MVRTTTTFIGTLLIASAFGSTTAADGTAAHYTFMNENAGYHAVLADITSNKISATTQMSSRLTNLWGLIGKNQPVAAITGTFFAFENQLPVADVVVNGKQTAFGYRGSVIAVDWYGNISILNAETRKPFDYFAYRYALRGGIRVVDKGTINPNPRAQGFTDSRIWGSAARTGVGITSSGKVLLMATRESVTLSAFGRAMKAQGAVDAVALDGGGSTMLYFNGSVKISPNRPLSNLFLIEKRSPFDADFQTHLTRITEAQSKGALKGVLDSYLIPGQR